MTGLTDASDDADASSNASKTMRLRYAGRCSGCTMDIAAGTVAVYHRETKSVTCVKCVAQDSSDLFAAEARMSGAASTADAIEAAMKAEEQEFVVAGGTAGSSARREFDRRKNKRETRIREGHPVLGGLILALTDVPQTTTAWSTGARGEELLGARLDGLAHKGVRALHDRRIPRSRANIDHIVVCPSGVFVIDAKKYKGRPSMKVDGGIIRPRVETLLVNARPRPGLVEGVRGQIGRVQGALEDAGLAEVPVSGMLCFVEADWPIFGGDFVIAGIQVLWPRKAAELLSRPGPLGDVSQRAHRALAQAFPPA